ncbi:hypothetical protein KVT40_001336 [Elsinoe batatas]|uniref:PD-(D/E)XK nuclease-like domain-containing protein n=1 Tax=Elsinoe batatas TaxID=2601811 RepID=A0A8K0PIP4_9PEZI|nr:hypothetical protein KVT40_001336 [Elsinoe batatas]
MSTAPDLYSRGRSRTRKFEDDSGQRAKRHKQAISAFPIPSDMADLFTNRPILLPLSPSTSRNSSASPARTRSVSPQPQLHHLQNATPRIITGESRDAIPEGPLWDLRRRLRQAARRGYVPTEIRHRLSQRSIDDLEEDAFGEGLVDPMPVQVFEAHIDRIQAKARKCIRFGRDEAACCQVVQLVLDLAADLDCNATNARRFEILDVKTQGPATGYLPLRIAPIPGHQPTDNDRISKKKTDFAVAFDPESSVVAALSQLVRIPGSHAYLPLSHCSDGDTSTIPLQCAVEVKKEDGGKLEGKIQLVTWHASALMHTKFLQAVAGNQPARLPASLVQTGWVVVADRWELYFTFESENGDLINIGPVLSEELGTMDNLSLFRLVAVLRALFAWMALEYWTTFRDLVYAAIQNQQ